MAARVKKKGSLSQADRETQNIQMGEAVLPAEPDTGLFVSSDSGFVADRDDSSPLGLTNPEHLKVESESNEVKMNTNPEISDTQFSDGTEMDDAVEAVINLEPNLSIQNVVKLYDKLKRAYAVYDAIEIDASHVASVDTASLQLFVALKKDAIKHKKEVDFFQPSPRFVESARLLDLLDVLEIIHV